ncbi:phytanoyl-CoA dioxygenase family protein [Neobacillus niacini]|uniref:phytanoyl-CoA dioxygenase family protein n=1 Tax=Neobacillus niacini TaxID=86668 RepID=UPI0005EF1A5E|nr:phytanoyl-CoA dioxygenase family protein [Neobacillus niacini]
MVKNSQNGVVEKKLVQQFHEEGFMIARGLLTEQEIDHIKNTVMDMHAGGPIKGCYKPAPKEKAGNDPLLLYPRMMHPHKVNHTLKSYMLHPNIKGVLAELFEEEPIAAQSMFYFKPPGARGQALHQDNFYLKVEPGTCIAAWVAIDDADEENGGLVVVPKTNDLDILCPHKANIKASFTSLEVDVPEGKSIAPCNMKAGDVLFFNGSVIHGSYPNQTKDRFRRALICHYVAESTSRIGKGYAPLYRFDGSTVDMEANGKGLPCGTDWEYEFDIH